MSCPDWSRLAAHREDLEDSEPEGWGAALEHLDGGCKECRPRALAADPTLVFRRLPVVDLKPAEEVSEIESMRQAVAAMRTASRLEALETGGRRGFQGWRRWAAAAVLAVAALSLGSDDSWQVRPAGIGGLDGVDALGVGAAGLAASGFDDAFAVMPASLITGAAGTEMDEVEPLVEELSNPAARVYEMRTEGLDAVFIASGA